MKDLTERLEDLAVDAAECDLIANLTVDTEKQELLLLDRQLILR